MTEIIGGALMVLSGGALNVASLRVLRRQGRRSLELEHSPVPKPDDFLDALCADAEAALARLA